MAVAKDPSENVKALVEVNERWRDVVRDRDNKRHDDLRAAETRRIDELAAQKQIFDLKLAEIIKNNQETTAALLASQVKEVKTDLQVELRGLNQFRYESSGKGIGLASIGGWIATIITIAISGAALYFKGN